MTRSTSFLLVFGFMLAAAIPGGCGSVATLKDDGGACEPPAGAPCYSGPPSAMGVGTCSPGTAVCSADGSSDGECVGSVLPAFQSCSTGVDTDCDGAAACSGAHRWSRGFTGQGYKAPAGLGIDKNGNISLAGEFDNTIDLGDGKLQADTSLMLHDLFVARYDATGAHLWSKKIGDESDQRIYGFASDSDGNMILSGYSETPVQFDGTTLESSFTLKIDPDGKAVWSLAESGYIAADGEGNIILAGGFEEPYTIGDTTLTSAGGRDVFIAKFDPAGKFLWAISAGGAGSEYVHQIAVDGAGNIVVSGQYSGIADLGGGPLEPGTNDTMKHAFVAKFDKNGSFLWSRGFTGDLVRLYVLAADGGGSTVISGGMLGVVDFGGGHVLDSNDVFLTKLDKSGATLFSKAYASFDANGANTYANVGSVAFDAEDNMLVLGAFATTIDLGGGFKLKASDTAAFVAKYDASGKIIWGLTPGGGFAIHHASGIGADSTGSVVVAGMYDNGMDFGGGILYGEPDQESIFFANLAP